jgi:hypothetical protein
MKRLIGDYYNNGCNICLRCIAYFILQPLFISMKWEIKPKTAARLKSYMPLLSEATFEAGEFFNNFKKVCVSCSGDCCRGLHDRFTVFDHITYVASGTRGHRQWGYYLSPFRPSEINMHGMTKYCAYLDSDGCKLPYPERPMNCVYGYCGKIGKIVTDEQKIALNKIRRKLNKVRFMYTLHLLCGGMKFIGNDDGRKKQNVFIDNRKHGSPTALAKRNSARLS